MSDPTMIILAGRGRRPRADAPSRYRIQVRMTDAERKRVERAAASERKSVSEFIRDAANEIASDFSDEKPFCTDKIQE